VVVLSGIQPRGLSIGSGIFSRGQAAAALTLVRVSALGSAIGNMSNLTAAFDDNDDQGNGAGAALASARCFVGQAWAAPKTIGQMAIFDPNNEGWCSNGGTVSIRIWGHSSNAPGSATMLASVAGAYVIPRTVVTVAQSDIITTNAYPYTWAEVSGGGGASTNYVAEVRFWELV
jgi:hypothetical protein